MDEAERIARDLQARIIAFMDARGGYVASASEHELFALLLAYGDDRAAAERARCASVQVIGKKTTTSADYQAGWFDGVEDCLDAIRALG
jgi:hypothetical protein